jgi:DNA repair exonuclease SbcCD ATPase subunit
MKVMGVKAENFGPFSKLEFGLDGLGLVLVQGENQVNSSADSNGSGKSYLLETIPWCWFGRTMRGQSGDEVVKQNVGKNCRVESDIRNGTQDIKIVRCRKHKDGRNSVQVFVDGVDRTLGTNKETDKFICDLLGLDFNTFIRSVYFDGGKVIAFPTLTDKEIKEVFEKVLGLEELSKVAEFVKKRAGVERAAANALTTEIAFAQSAISTAEVEMLAARDKSERWAVDQIERIKIKQAGIAEIGAQKKALPDFAAMRVELDGRKAKIEENLAAFAALDGMLAKHAEEVKAHDTVTNHYRVTLGQRQALRDTVADKNKYQAPRENVEAALRIKQQLDWEVGAVDRAGQDASSAESQIGKPCGECKKIYQREDLGTIIETYRSHIAEHEANAKSLAHEFKTAIAEIEAGRVAALAQIDLELAGDQENLSRMEAGRVELDAKRAKLDKLVQLRAEASAGLSALRHEYDALDSAARTAAHLDASVAALQAEIEALSKQASPFEEDFKRWNQRKDEAQVTLGGKTMELTDAQKKLAMLDVIERAYGRAGLKAHILETVTPVLNERANDYANRLADGTVQIEFSTVTRNKDGSMAERFSVNVRNSQGTEGYLGNSSGERKKIDLAIALAMSDLVAARSSRPIDLWICDEIAESLDVTAQERVVDLLNHKAAERGTLMVISHTDMKMWIPNCVTVVKKVGGSELRLGGGW